MNHILKEQTETRITLRETEATIENINNGVPMNRRSILPSNLAFAMLGIMEDEAIVSHLLREKKFDELFEGFFDANHINGESFIGEMNAIINMATKYISEAENEDAALELFLTLVANIDPTEFSEEETTTFIRKTLSKIRCFEDKSVIQELFFYLLEEVNLLGDLKGSFAGRIQEQLFKQASSSLDKGLIHSLFKVTSQKAEREWILEVLEKHIPKKKACSSPLLPKGCFIYQELLDGAKIVGIEVKAQRFDVKYHRNYFEEVGHPKMLFLFVVRGSNILDCKIVCVKDHVLTPDTQLYRFPYSNVHGDTSTCWPDLKSYRVKSIAHIGTLPLTFIQSGSNDHLFQGENLGERLHGLQGEDFNEDELIPLKLTFEQWLEVMKGKL